MVATVSFSLTIGTHAELEQLGEGAVGVAVVAAPGHVVDGEQHLPDADAVPGELLGVAVHQQPLADRRGRLLGGEVAGPARQAERREPGGDRAGGDQHDLGAARAGRRRARRPARSTRSGSMPPAAVVSDDEPTLTTTRAPRRRGRTVTAVPVVRGRPRQPSASARSPRCRLVVGTPSRRATSARVSCSPRSAIAASISRRRCGAGRLLEPVVLAAPAEQLGAGLDPGSKSKTTALSASPMSDGVARRGAELEQPVLDAEPVEPVGEVADGLVVAEVGLPDPALGLLAADPPAARRSRVDRELGAAAGRRSAAARSGWARRAGASARRAATSSAIANDQLAQALVAGGRDREHRAARAPRGRPAPSASSRPSGTSILFSATSRGRSSRPP